MNKRGLDKRNIAVAVREDIENRWNKVNIWVVVIQTCHASNTGTVLTFKQRKN